MRLIDADALVNLVMDTEILDSGFKWAFSAIVNGEPTIEPEQSTGRWIPCSERLPEVGEDVLLSVGGMYTAEGCLREDGDWAQFRWNTIQRKDMVGAWMPLPEPYHEVEHDER